MKAPTSTLISLYWLLTLKKRIGLYMFINVKKLQFIHMLTASDTSKLQKLQKGDITPSAHRLNVNVLLSNITFL